MISAYRINQIQGDFQRIFDGIDIHSLDEANRLIPDGVYTTFRTYEKNKVLDIEGHFDRLEHSAILLGYELKLNRELIRKILRDVLESLPADEARIRISVPLTGNKNLSEVYIFIEKLKTPSLEEYSRGVKVITIHFYRENPAAKTTSFIHLADEIRKKLPHDVNEAIMVDKNGRMLEGLSSNFFAISKGKVFTDESHVLAGLTRKMVLEIIKEVGLPVCPEGFLYSEIDQMDEAFITSTSRGVLPVRAIDDKIIGNGKVGDLTGKIMQRYKEKIKEAIEPV